MQVKMSIRVASGKIQKGGNNSLFGERMRETDDTCWRRCIYEYRICV